MIAVLRYDSFFSVWYWVLTIVVWTAVSWRTMGVPHDLLLRAARLPGAARRVDLLAGLAAERAAGIAAGLGAAGAAAAGFAMAALATLAYLYRVEAAEAAFLILFPLGIVGVGGLRLAWRIRSEGLTGEALRRQLGRRRAINQAIAVVAILVAAFSALGHPPRFGLN